MRSPEINGEGELSRQPANLVHLEKWPLKRSVCVCAAGKANTDCAEQHCHYC